MKFDLGVYANETFDVNFCEKHITSIKKPSKKLLVKLDSFDKEFAKITAMEKAISQVEDIALEILNNNTEGKVFTTTDLEKSSIDFTLQLGIFKAYFSWTFNLMANPN